MLTSVLSAVFLVLLFAVAPAVYKWARKRQSLSFLTMTTSIGLIGAAIALWLYYSHGIKALLLQQGILIAIGIAGFVVVRIRFKRKQESLK